MVALQSEEATRLNGQQFPDNAREMNKSLYGNNMKTKRIGREICGDIVNYTNNEP